MSDRKKALTVWDAIYKLLRKLYVETLTEAYYRDLSHQ